MCTCLWLICLPVTFLIAGIVLGLAYQNTPHRGVPVRVPELVGEET
jgi:hypothetical protein